jgi:hypothetical protein
MIPKIPEEKKEGYKFLLKLLLGFITPFVITIPGVAYWIIVIFVLLYLLVWFLTILGVPQ